MQRVQSIVERLFGILSLKALIEAPFRHVSCCDIHKLAPCRGRAFEEGRVRIQRMRLVGWQLQLLTFVCYTRVKRKLMFMSGVITS